MDCPPPFVSLVKRRFSFGFDPLVDYVWVFLQIS